MSEKISEFNVRFSRKQRVGIGVLAAMELTAKVAAARDLRRRSASQVRGSKWMWSLALLVNTFGPLSYFLWGRR
ncbi:MAG: PLD nuclease N-terminal domain-containing protein [Solirubrobacteraceae bacterium]